MKLAEYISRIYLPSRVNVSPVYATNVQSSAVLFSRHLDRPAMLADLNQESICRFLATYHKSGWSARSTNNHRQNLLAVWADAADRCMVADEPNRRRIRKIPESHDPPTAWTREQVAALLAEARRQPGMVGDVPAADWWFSLLLTIYYTSCRIGSMLAVSSACFDGQGLLVRKQKNNRPQWFALPQICCEAIGRTRPDSRAVLWLWPWNRRTIFTRARTLIESAGLPCPKTGRQLFHRLRRTTITLCAQVDPSVAQRTAGHANYATTERHYVDPRMLRQTSAADILPDPLETIPSHPRLRIFG